MSEKESKKHPQTPSSAAADTAAQTAAALASAGPAGSGTIEGVGEAIPEFKVPEGLTSLIQRYWQYDPLVDARDRRSVGQKAPPIHGLLVGFRNLPATIPDQNGELQPWRVMVIELLQPAPVKLMNRQSRSLDSRMALPGEHIIFTSTTAMESVRANFGLDDVAADESRIYEIYIEPEVSQTRAGLSLWTFAELKMGKPRARTPAQLVSPFSNAGRVAAMQGRRPMPALPGQPATSGASSPSVPAAVERSPV